MLVLARKPGEVIKIGSDIAIKVLEIRGDTVRLGIDALAICLCIGWKFTPKSSGLIRRPPTAMFPYRICCS